MYFTHDFLSKPTAFWVETYTLHCVYTIVKLISHLEQKEKKSRKQIIDQFSVYKSILAQLMLYPI